MKRSFSLGFAFTSHVGLCVQSSPSQLMYLKVYGTKEDLF